MENLKILEAVDIRTAKPVLRSKIPALIAPYALLQHMFIYQDHEKYLVKMQKDGFVFYNRVDLKHLIFLVAIHSQRSPCTAEHIIMTTNFPVFEPF